MSRRDREGFGGAIRRVFARMAAPRPFPRRARMDLARSRPRFARTRSADPTAGFPGDGLIPLRPRGAAASNPSGGWRACAAGEPGRVRGMDARGSVEAGRDGTAVFRPRGRKDPFARGRRGFGDGDIDAARGGNEDGDPGAWAARPAAGAWSKDPRVFGRKGGSRDPFVSARGAVSGAGGGATGRRSRRPIGRPRSLLSRTRGRPSFARASGGNGRPSERRSSVARRKRAATEPAFLSGKGTSRGRAAVGEGRDAAGPTDDGGGSPLRFAGGPP